MSTCLRPSYSFLLQPRFNKETTVISITNVIRVYRIDKTVGENYNLMFHNSLWTVVALQERSHTGVSLPWPVGDFLERAITTNPAAHGSVPPVLILLKH